MQVVCHSGVPIFKENYPVKEGEKFLLLGLREKEILGVISA